MSSGCDGGWDACSPLRAGKSDEERVAEGTGEIGVGTAARYGTSKWKTKKSSATMQTW